MTDNGGGGCLKITIDKGYKNRLNIWSKNTKVYLGSMSRDLHSCSHWLVSHLVDECLEEDDSTGEDSMNGEEDVIGLYRDDAVGMLPLVLILKQCHP